MQNVGNLSAQVAERVRDPNFNATTQIQTISLMSYAQQMVNGALADFTGSTTLTLQPRSLIYQLSGSVPQAIRVLAVRDASGRDLNPLGPPEALSWVNPKWVTAVSDTPRGWTMMGHDVLVVYPGVIVAQPVTVVYGALTPTLAGTGDTTVVPNEDDDAILDLTEILLLIKNRDLDPAAPAIERFSKRLQTLREEMR